MTIGSWTSTEHPQGTIFEPVLYNRALSDDDALRLVKYGVDFSDKDAGATDAVMNDTVANGGFEAWTAGNPDNWTVGSSLTVAEETVDVQVGSSALDLTGAGAIGSSANNQIYQAVLIKGQRYRVRMWVKRTSGAGNLQLGVGYTEKASIANAGVWSEETVEFVATDTSAIPQPTRLTLGAVAGEQWQVDSVRVTKIGTVIRPRLHEVYGQQVIDDAAHKLHGTITGVSPVPTIKRDRTPLYFGGIVANGELGANGSHVFPAGSLIVRLVLRNETDNAITNIRLGSTSGAQDIVANVNLGANATLVLTIVDPAIAATVAKKLWASADAWNGATVNLTGQIERIQ